MNEVVTRLLSYLRGIWTNRWYAVAVAWVVAVIGWIIVYKLPDQYEASARVFVDTQSVLKPLLSGLAVQPDVDEQVRIVSRTLINRPNVEKIARMADLDIKATTAEVKEGLIDGLITKIKLEGTGQDNLYNISYRDVNPETAKRVVQALLTTFVENSLGGQRKDTEIAQRFLDEQIKAYEQRLVGAEEALKDFKRRNMGVMPEQGKDYYGSLQEAGARIRQAKLELREAENARDALRKQLAGEEPVLLSAGKTEFIASVTPELDARISSLEKNLDNLRLNYTELHPDIIATKRIIEQLKEQRKEEAKLKQPTMQGTASNQNPVFQQLKVALADNEARVASLMARVTEYEERYQQLKAAAHAIPQVEAELTQLNRDYEVNKANYEQLLARRESAQITGDMDARTSTVDFKVIDPPRVPNTPTAPNRPLLISLVLLFGLAIGITVAFLINEIRPTFNDRRTLREVTSLPLLGSVSMVWTENQKRKRRRGAFAFVLSCVTLFGTYAGVMAMLLLTAQVA
jgi:polysaccharide chain length determinant protein (PEP-CTERM system associated)